MQNFLNSSTLPSERCKTIFEPTTTFSKCKEDPFGVSVSVILKIFRNSHLRFFKSKEFPGRSLDTAPNRQLVEYLHAEELESWFSAPGNFPLETCAPISSQDIDAESTCVPERLLELLWDQGQRWEADSVVGSSKK